MAQTDGYTHLTLSVRKRLWFWPATAAVYASLWILAWFMDEERMSGFVNRAAAFTANHCIKIDVT